MIITLTTEEVISAIRKHWNFPAAAEIVILPPETITASLLSLIREVEKNLNANNKIGAIKAYREATRIPDPTEIIGPTEIMGTRCVGLMEAKDIVESWESAKRAILNFGKLVTIKYLSMTGYPRIGGYEYVPFV
jgi:ribosomal protein L7/L12